MGNTFGTSFRVTTFGESHGAMIGAVIDGCPARVTLRAADIQAQVDRRRPGRTDLATGRREEDQVAILSGLQGDLTLGTPIALGVTNRDARPGDYAALADIPRPSHADYTYQAKYGIRAASGGGRASARETVVRVAAGAVAEQFLAQRFGVTIVAWASAVGAVDAPDLAERPLTRADVDASAVRCPDAAAAEQMEAEIRRARAELDSVGGVVTCVCRGVPAGWGEPVFDKLTALLAHAMLSIPAAKGFEFGSGFSATRLRGSQHNDAFIMKNGHLGTRTNRSGGIQGGISNGEPVVFRVAFKPVATIAQPQATVDFAGQPATLECRGRHDPCVVARAVPVVEAMAALVLADLALRQQAQLLAAAIP